MRIQRIKIKLLTLIGLIFISIFAPNVELFNSKSNLNGFASPKLSGDQSPIHIDGDWQDAITQGICTGSGTEFDPYIIQDFIIEGTGNDYCILIENSEKFFTIQNCTLSFGEKFGIRLINASNGKIINNTCFNDYFSSTLGIYATHSPQLTMNGNNCTENSIAIRIDYCNDSVISNNFCINNQAHGIVVHHSNNTIVSYNNCSLQKLGTQLSYSHFVNVFQNYYNSNSITSIEIFYSDHSTINNNRIENSDQGIDCTGSKNIIYKNKIVTNDVGIFIGLDNNKIRLNNISFNTIGVQIQSSISNPESAINNSIELNDFLNNSDAIFLIDSNGTNIISNNNIKNNVQGTFISNSENNIIENNVYDNNVFGIRYDGSYNNSIYLNQFTNNTMTYYVPVTSDSLWNSPKKITYIYNSQVYRNYTGNYWDQYSGIDTNGDGIGDEPYNLTIYEQDKFPLMDPISSYERLFIEGTEIKNRIISPLYPDETSIIEISVEVYNENYPITVELLYKYESEETWNLIPMEQEDIIFKQNLGPFNPNSMVLYYIRVVDNLELVDCFPVYAPHQFFKLEIGSSTYPAWKRSLKTQVLSLKEEIVYSIEYSLDIITEMLAISIMDFEHFAIKSVFESLIDVFIGRTSYEIFMQTTGKLDYLRELGVSEDMIDACIDFYRGESFTHNYILHLLDFIFDQVFSSISEGKSIIYEILSSRKFLDGELTKIQDALDKINQLFNNFDTWLDSLPNEMSEFQIKALNDILKSITKKITQAYEGNVDNIVTPSSIYPVSSVVNLQMIFNLIHNSLIVEQNLDGLVDIFSIFTGAASIATALRGGFIETAIWGALFSGGMVVKSNLKKIEFGLILGQFALTIFGLSDVISQALNYQLIFNDVIDFVMLNHVEPINFTDMKLGIISLESPNDNHIFDSVEYGSLTVKNIGAVDGNVIVSVNILTSDLKTVDRYYLHQYIPAGDEFSFTTAYYGRDSDFFGYQPYIIEFEVYMNSKCFGLANDVFFIGTLEILNNMENQVIDTGNYILEQGSNAWSKITTRAGDLWTSIWGGKANSDIDLRLWNEDKSTLLVGYNYSTHEIVNLIDANYSGPLFNPEYIKIPLPNGTTYYVELIGVELPHSEVTSLFYMNTGVRPGSIGLPLEINKTIYINKESSGNFTIILPIIESGGQNPIENLNLNFTSLNYLGYYINPTVDTINLSLNTGELKLIFIKFSYSSNLIEGYYTGVIRLINGTNLLFEVPICVQIMNRTVLYALNDEGAPKVSDPLISTTNPTEFMNVKVSVNVTDESQVQSVYFFYFVNNFNTWNSIKLEFSGNNTYSGVLPGQKAGDVIYFKIYALNNETHISINDNNGFYFRVSFQELQGGITGFNVAIISIILLGLTMIYYKRIKKVLYH